jgi:hypothetical protein
VNKKQESLCMLCVGIFGIFAKYVGICVVERICIVKSAHKSAFTLYYQQMYYRWRFYASGKMMSSGRLQCSISGEVKASYI